MMKNEPRMPQIYEDFVFLEKNKPFAYAVIKD